MKSYENEDFNDRIGFKKPISINVNEADEREAMIVEDPPTEDEEVEASDVIIEVPAGNNDAPTQAHELGTQLEKFEGFRAELAIAETLSEMKSIENKAAVMAEFARRNRIGQHIQNEWGKFRIEIEGKKGEWLDKNFPAGGDKKSRSKGATLKSEGITKSESASARLVNHNPELVLKVMSDIEKAEKIITPNSVVTGIRSEIKKEKNPAIQHKKEAPVPPIPPDNTNVPPASDNATKAPETEYALQVEIAKSIILGLQKQRSDIAKEIIAIEKQKKESTTPKQIEKFEKESSNKLIASDKIILAIENAYAELGCLQVFGTTIKKAKMNGYKTLVDASS